MNEPRYSGSTAGAPGDGHALWRELCRANREADRLRAWLRRALAQDPPPGLRRLLEAALAGEEPQPVPAGCAGAGQDAAGPDLGVGRGGFAPFWPIKTF